MGRWLRRLLILGIIAAVAGFVASRLMGSEEDDFDDFDDIEAGLDFQETPVEIDVPAQETSPTSTEVTQSASSSSNASDNVAPTTVEVDSSAAQSSALQAAPSGNGSQPPQSLQPSQPSRSTSTVASTGALTEDEVDGAGNGRNTTNESSDKLTEIKGIGPAYEARLEAVGITSFEELTKVDPEELAGQIGVIGGAQEVEGWIEQAQHISTGDEAEDPGDTGKSNHHSNSEGGQQ
ncbi:MAG: hypothetical protein M3014_00050 [Chloroflexota bacterium]|nr:hypothetical protein [Chloroflexota bacterium]